MLAAPRAPALCVGRRSSVGSNPFLAEVGPLNQHDEQADSQSAGSPLSSGMSPISENKSSSPRSNSVPRSRSFPLTDDDIEISRGEGTSTSAEKSPGSEFHSCGGTPPADALANDAPDDGVAMEGAEKVNSLNLHEASRPSRDRDLRDPGARLKMEEEGENPLVSLRVTAAQPHDFDTNIDSPLRQRGRLRPPHEHGFAFLQCDKGDEYYVSPYDVTRLLAENSNLPRSCLVEFTPVLDHSKGPGKFKAKDLVVVGSSGSQGKDSSESIVDHEESVCLERLRTMADPTRLLNNDPIMTHSIISGEHGDCRFPAKLFVNDDVHKRSLHMVLAKMYEKKIPMPSIVEKASTPHFVWFNDIDVLLDDDKHSHGGQMRMPSAEEQEFYLNRCLEIVAGTLRTWYTEIDPETGRPKWREHTEVLVTSSTGFAQRYKRPKVSFHFVWPEVIVDKEMSKKLWEMTLQEAERVEARKPAQEKAENWQGNKVSWPEVFDQTAALGDSLRMMFSDKWNKETRTYEGRKKLPLGLFKITLPDTAAGRAFAMEKVPKPEPLTTLEWLEKGSIRTGKDKSLFCLVPSAPGRQTARARAASVARARAASIARAKPTGANSIPVAAANPHLHRPRPHAPPPSSGSAPHSTSEEEEMLSSKKVVLKSRAEVEADNGGRSDPRDGEGGRGGGGGGKGDRSRGQMQPPRRGVYTVGGSGKGGGKHKPKPQQRERSARRFASYERPGKGRYNGGKGRPRSDSRHRRPDSRSGGKGKGKSKSVGRATSRSPRRNYSRYGSSTSRHHDGRDARQRQPQQYTECRFPSPPRQQHNPLVPINGARKSAAGTYCSANNYGWKPATPKWQVSVYVAAKDLDVSRQSVDLRVVVCKPVLSTSVVAGRSGHAKEEIRECCCMHFQANGQLVIPMNDAMATFAAALYGLRYCRENKLLVLGGDERESSSSSVCEDGASSVGNITKTTLRHGDPYEGVLDIKIHTDVLALKSFIDGKAKKFPPGSGELRKLIEDDLRDYENDVSVAEAIKGTNLAKIIGADQFQTEYVKEIADAICSGCKEQPEGAL